MRKSCKKDYEVFHPYFLDWATPGNSRWVKRTSHKSLRRKAKKDIERDLDND